MGSPGSAATRGGAGGAATPARGAAQPNPRGRSRHRGLPRRRDAAAPSTRVSRPTGPITHRVGQRHEPGFVGAVERGAEGHDVVAVPRSFELGGQLHATKLGAPPMAPRHHVDDADRPRDLWGRRLRGPGKHDAMRGHGTRRPCAVRETAGLLGQGLPSTTVRGAIFVVAGSPTGQQVRSRRRSAPPGGPAAPSRGARPLLGGHPGRCHSRRRRHGTEGPTRPCRALTAPPFAVRARTPEDRGEGRTAVATPQPLSTIDPSGPWVDTDVAFVWQRHELFQQAGLRLARKLAVPSVLFVPATVVWEAEHWGVSPRVGELARGRRGSRRPCDRPTSWPAALPRSLNRRAASVSRRTRLVVTSSWR